MLAVTCIFCILMEVYHLIFHNYTCNLNDVVFSSLKNLDKDDKDSITKTLIKFKISTLKAFIFVHFIETIYTIAFMILVFTIPNPTVAAILFVIVMGFSITAGINSRLGCPLKKFHIFDSTSLLFVYGYIFYFFVLGGRFACI